MRIVAEVMIGNQLKQIEIEGTSSELINIEATVQRIKAAIEFLQEENGP